MPPRGSADAKLTVDVSRLRVGEFTSWSGPVGRSVSRLASATVVEQKRLAPRRTGALAKSIRWTRGFGPRGITFTTGSSLRYAGWMEKGTRPHVIRPRRPGGRLRFIGRTGDVVFAGQVRHPGTKAYRYLERGYRKALTVWKRTG